LLDDVSLLSKIDKNRPIDINGLTRFTPTLISDTTNEAVGELAFIQSTTNVNSESQYVVQSKRFIGHVPSSSTLETQ
jgi:hypothetical protein